MGFKVTWRAGFKVTCTLTRTMRLFFFFDLNTTFYVLLFLCKPFCMVFIFVYRYWPIVFKTNLAIGGVHCNWQYSETCEIRTPLYPRQGVLIWQVCLFQRVIYMLFHKLSIGLISEPYFRGCPLYGGSLFHRFHCILKVLHKHDYLCTYCYDSISITHFSLLSECLRGLPVQFPYLAWGPEKKQRRIYILMKVTLLMTNIYIYDLLFKTKI